MNVFTALTLAVNAMTPPNNDEEAEALAAIEAVLGDRHTGESGLKEASRIVLDLAIGNIIVEDGMEQEQAQQEAACDLLQDFLGTAYADS